MNSKNNFTVDSKMLLAMALLRAKYGSEFVEERAEVFKELVPWLPIPKYEWELCENIKKDH